MRYKLRIELRDVPGQLLKALEPIAHHGGNIIAVHHFRDQVRNNYVPVLITFELDDENKLERILEDLERRGVKILDVEGKYEKSLLLMLVGHVIDTDLRDTIDRINQIDGIVVSEVEVAMPSPSEESSVLMRILIKDDRLEDELWKKLEEIASEKKLMIIRPLEG